MKKYKKGIAVLMGVLLSFCMSACKPSAEPIKLPYDVCIGDEFTIVLSTGSYMRWEKPKFVKEGLEYLGCEFHTPNDDPHWYGGGRLYYSFKALKEGCYTIEFVSESVVTHETARDFVYEVNIIP